MATGVPQLASQSCRVVIHNPDRFSRLPGMDDRRRRTLPAGAVLVREVMKAFHASSVLTSEYALRDGLVSDWILRNRPQVDLARTVPDPRRRSVLAVMKRYGVHEKHARAVASSGLKLFDATFALHGMRIDDRRMLEFAALLHDVGHHISGKDHHLHGQYLIRNTRMSGFTAPEIALLAALVRYHRGGRPKQSQTTFSSFSSLEQQKVLMLAGMLSLADALDRGHDQTIEELSVDVTDDAIQIRASARGPAHLERWAAKQRATMLSSALGRPIEVEIEQHEES